MYTLLLQRSVRLEILDSSGWPHLIVIHPLNGRNWLNKILCMASHPNTYAYGLNSYGELRPAKLQVFGFIGTVLVHLNHQGCRSTGHTSFHQILEFKGDVMARSKTSHLPKS